MIEKKPVTTRTSHTTRTSTTSRSPHSTHVSQATHSSGKPGFFTKENYTWMLAGLIVIAIGMLLLSGGKSNDPNIFDQKQVYSPIRITVAPLLIAIGLGLEVLAIFKRPKA